MVNKYFVWTLGLVALAGLTMQCSRTPVKLQRVGFNNPGLVVDLGVGLWAWPLPMDYDGDGDFDLLVACRDKPYKGVYFFENVDGDVAMPLFRAGVRIGPAQRDMMPSYVGDQVVVLTHAKKVIDISSGRTEQIYPTEKIHNPDGRTRADQWRQVDYDGDGALDLIVGAGDWTEYGWDDAFNERGEWTHGPLHGYVYLIKNSGTTEQPEYAEPAMLTAAGEPIDVYGMPSPNLADFDKDGDLDLICGEFLDKFTYFENIGTRSEPEFAKGRFLSNKGGVIKMDLEMIVPVALDWDRDGDVDLIVGQEDGRVVFVENSGRVVDGVPQFECPRFFQQQAADLKFGALVTPFSVDWDDDGDADLICGNTAGYIGFIENLDGGDPPKWAAPHYLTADGQVIRVQAGPNGSIQGPCEAKWGYTTLTVADWDMDGLKDILVNSIWGKVIWFKNVGERGRPELAGAQPVQVEWPGQPPKPAWFWWTPQDRELVTQWRTTPFVFDWNKDGLNDLIMLDHEGYLAFFQRQQQAGELKLLPGRRIFYDQAGKHLRLSEKKAGGSGRRKFCFVDWDLDGRLDLLLNSRNIDFLRNIKQDGDSAWFENKGNVDSCLLAGHTTSPTIVDWDANGVPDLLIGAEDGHFYFMKNPLDKNSGEAPAPLRTVSRPDFPLKPPRHGGVYVVAHRGAHEGIPENTLAAYRKAIELGADFVEIDVRTTKDGEFVSMHNAVVDAYVAGVTGPVRNFTLADLKTLDIGSRIAPQWRDERIPTFDEILDLCRGKIGVYLDLKDAPVAPLVEKIKARGMEQDVIWYARTAAQEQVRELCPSCVPMPDPHSPKNLPTILQRLQPFVIASDMGQLSKDYVATAHAAGAGVIVDEKEGTPDEWRTILSWGADGIQTDHPQELIEFLKGRNVRSR